MTPAPTPSKTVKKASPLATLLAYIQRQGRLLAFITLDLFLDFYIYLYCIFRGKKIVERLFAYVQRQWHRLPIVVRWIRLMLTKDNLRAYLRRHWRLLALLILYIFFRPIFEKKLASLLQFFDPSWGSAIVWLGVIVILIALVCTHSLGYEWYLFSQKYSKSFVVILFGLWAYYHFGGAKNSRVIETDILCIYYMDIFLVVCACLLIVRVRSYREERARQRTLRARMRQATLDGIKEGYQIDQPITSKDEDLLGRRGEAESLAEKIFKTDTSMGAFTLGLTAPWGAGKTSFMLVMREYLRKKPSQEVIVMSFNPWMYRKASNLTQVFFEELSRTLAPYNSDLASAFIRYVRSLLAQESNAWLQLAARLLPQESNEKSITEQYDSLSQEICRLGRKIFIIIDDVDRLEGEELVELFALVRNSSSFPYMSYVLAYDKEYVASQLKGCFDQHTHRYMEKILQEEYALAQITPEQLEKALKMELERMGYGALFTTIREYAILHRYHLPTIRAIKRICNTLSSCRKDLEGNVALFDWFIIELIRIQYPRLFDFLRENYSRVFYAQGDKRSIRMGEEKKDRKPWMAEALSDHPMYGYGIDFSNYISEHHESLQIKSVGLVIELLLLIWGEGRDAKALQANHGDYIRRYFYGTLWASEIDEGEFRRHIALPFDEVKEYVKQKINLMQEQDLYRKIKRQHADSEEMAEKLLITVFYLAPSRLFTRVDFDDQINKLNHYLDWDDRKIKLMEIFEQPDIRIGVLLYLIMATRYVEEPSINRYTGEDETILPFSSEELEEKKVRLFMKYLAEHKSRDLGSCYILWRECRIFKPTGQQNRWGESQLKPVVRHPEMDKEMKQAIQESLEAVIPYFIARGGTSQENAYKLLLPEPIWGLYPNEENLENESFWRFIDRQDGDSSPVIKEFQEFLKRWIENKDEASLYRDSDDFEESVFVEFRFNHIEPKGQESLFRDEDCKPRNWPEDEATEMYQSVSVS